MDVDAFHHWFDNFAKAWELGEPRAIVPLLAADVIYRETPFSDPVHGIVAMTKYLESIFHTQNEINFDYEIITVTPDIGVVQWWLTYFRPHDKVQFKRDGIALVSLDSQGLCKTFHQWWHEQEIPAV